MVSFTGCDRPPSFFKARLTIHRTPYSRVFQGFSDFSASESLVHFKLGARTRLKRSAIFHSPLPEEDLSAYDQILSLDFASSRCCAAQVQLALKQSDPASGALLFTDFLVLLRLNKKWQIISKVFSSVPLSEQSYQEPYDALAYADPVRGILSYMRGVHQSSPSLVSESFHGAARLCFSDQQEELVRWSRAEFFEVLQARAKSLDDPQARRGEGAEHVNSAELREALRFDKILSVRKAGPDVALIKLQVGLPPVLYTDFLSMLRLNGRWWIIAKSSDGEPF
ncbi:unnamed protein product [Durusdinium trenchii]|uniref:Uncharacterized protein n=1 Tax=Durusdinium trenchii TaxID=1381693 RepID=A0ABP0I064_9DINO